MHSSISSSEPLLSSGPQTRNAAWVRSSFLLLAVIAMIVSACEIGARVLVPRISQVEGRTVHEYASMFRPAAAPAKKVAAFVGNSLLGAALDFDEFAARTASRMEARRFFVDNTAYYDWYYGLRRLFKEGARPEYVVLMFSERQLLANTIRGDYFAYRLMSGSDVIDVARTLDVHPTDAAGYAFANVSAFYGLRGEIRKVILGRLMPDLPDLTAKLVPQPPAGKLGEQVFSIGVERLKVLDNLCKAHNARLILLPAPQPTGNSGARLTRTASLAGIPSVAPFKDEQYHMGLFRDGFHLNAAGKKLYTGQLAMAILDSDSGPFDSSR